MDFVRVTASIEIINGKLLEEVKFKIFDLLEPVIDNIDKLSF